MASKWRAVAVGGVVVAALMQAEHEAPGATGRGAAELRQIARRSHRINLHRIQLDDTQ